MPGRNHSPGAPLGAMNNVSDPRSSRGVADRQRYGESDIRLGEVRGMWGPLFPIISNPGNPVPYIVRNQAGIQTWAPGSKVLMGSLSGDSRGEAVLGGPPPGGLGGPTTRSQRRRGQPTPPDVEGTFSYRAIAYNSGRDSVVILRGRQVTSADPDIHLIELVEVGLQDIPHSDDSLGMIFWSREIANMISIEETNLVALSGNRVMLTYSVGDAGVGTSSYEYITLIISYDGVELHESTVDGSSAAFGDSNPQSVIIDGSLYSIEAEPVHSVSGPPFQAQIRVVKRSLSTGAVTAAYSWPNTTPYDGRTTRAWIIESIFDGGGFPMVSFSHLNTVFDYNAYIRTFTTALTANIGDDVPHPVGDSVGSVTYHRFGSSGSFIINTYGSGNDYYLGDPSDIGTLISSSATGGGYALAIAPIAAGDTVLLGGGGGAITSILRADGTIVLPA